MPDITIPDAALEAAYHQWRRIDPIIGTGDVRLIIAAAAPYIAAQALEDLLTDAPPTGRVPHPFHSWREWIAYRALRLREPIEADHG